MPRVGDHALRPARVTVAIRPIYVRRQYYSGRSTAETLIRCDLCLLCRTASHCLLGLPAHTRRQVSLAAATAPESDTLTHALVQSPAASTLAIAPVAVAVAVAVAMNARVLRTYWRQASAQGWSAARTAAARARVLTWCRRPWQPL